MQAMYAVPMASSSRPKKRAALPATQVFDWTLDDVSDGASFTSQHVSEDKRRTYEKVVPVDLPSPLKKKQKWAAPPPFSDIGDGFEYVFEDLEPADRAVPPNRAVKKHAKRYLSSVGLVVHLYSAPTNGWFQDAPLAQWVPLRDEYLAEVLRLEGRGDVAKDFCPACPGPERAASPEYRCADCLHPDLVCASCCVCLHSDHLLHRIEVSLTRQLVGRFTDCGIEVDRAILHTHLAPIAGIARAAQAFGMQRMYAASAWPSRFYSDPYKWNARCVGRFLWML